MSERDWVETMFPGDPLGFPNDTERGMADSTIAFWSEKWDETPFTIRRRHTIDVTDPAYDNTLAGTPTNRAYIRSRLRRWWRHSLPSQAPR